MAKKNKDVNGQLYRVTPIAIYLRPFKEQAAIGYKLPAEEVYTHTEDSVLSICMQVGQTNSITHPPIVDHDECTVKSSNFPFHMQDAGSL